MVEAIILAAGYSSRAECFKMELMIEEQPLLQHVIQAFYPICDAIYVVGGYQYKRLIPMIEPYQAKVELVVNQDFDQGMFSSVQEGVRHIQGERFFLTPGDYPLIHKEICQEMLKVQEEYVIPSYQYHGGHPILLPFSAKKEILEMDIQSNLKKFLKNKKIAYFEVEDISVIKDLDTQKDYKELLEIKKGGVL